MFRFYGEDFMDSHLGEKKAISYVNLQVSTAVGGRIMQKFSFGGIDSVPTL